MCFDHRLRLHGSRLAQLDKHISKRISIRWQVAQKRAKAIPQALKRIGSQALHVGAKAPTPENQSFSATCSRAVFVSPTVAMICVAAIPLRSNMAKSSAIKLDFPFWFPART